VRLFPATASAAYKGTVEIKLASIPPGKYELQLLRVGYHHHDAFTVYLEMSAPAQLTRAQEQILRDASRGGPESGRQIEINSTGEFTNTVSPHANEVFS
jgi:beta-xylosidase